MSIRTARQSSTIQATERLTKGGFAEFVDNVDTRARTKIHLISPSGGLTPGRCARWAGVTVAIDNIDKLGAKPDLLGMSVTVSVMYVSRERYVCLTGENLAGWIWKRKTLLFLPPALRTDYRIAGLARSTFHKT